MEYRRYSRNEQPIKNISLQVRTFFHHTWHCFNYYIPNIIIRTDFLLCMHNVCLFVTSIKSVPWTNFSSHTHYKSFAASRDFNQPLANIRSFAHLLDRSFGCLCGLSSAHDDLSPNSNLFVIVVVNNYESASLSMASFLCIQELDSLHFVFEIYLRHWSTQQHVNKPYLNEKASTHHYKNIHASPLKALFRTLLGGKHSPPSLGRKVDSFIEYSTLLPSSPPPQILWHIGSPLKIFL